MALASDKGSREQLAATVRGLTPTERADLASTVASNFGRRTPEDDFSPARFVTQVQKMSAATREVVFGQEGAEAIHDLLAIAMAKRDVSASLNRSRSGQVSNYDRWLTSGLSLSEAGGGYAAGGAGGAAAGAVAAGMTRAGALNLSARLLTNPGFVRWLGRAPSNASPAQITSHVQQLGALAIREPSIRGEVAQVQHYLVDAGTTRSFASEGGPTTMSRPIAVSRLRRVGNH